MLGISRAPEINRPGLTWFNTDAPISLADLHGRIGILDFWTACCINCIQVVPILRKIEEAFPRDVAVIGIHSPKFEAERSPDSVRHAISRYGITHPVAHDPDKTLWQQYAVRAWPTLVFLSPDGHVIGQLAGEPHPEALMQGLKDMLRHFGGGSETTPGSFAVAKPHDDIGGPLRYPGKIKACPDASGTPGWAVADSGHHQIVLFDDNGREISRYGSGQSGFFDGRSRQASFCSPQGLSCDRGSIWVADTGNHALRRIDRITGHVTTVAGLGWRGSALRQRQPSLSTALASPWDIERVGDILVFANAGSHQIGAFSPAGGEVWLLAGTGGENMVDGPGEYALLAQPSGVSVAAGGDGVFFVDAETSSVRLLRLGINPWVTTEVGRGLFEFGYRDGPFDQALLQHPLAIAGDNGTLLVADSYNGALRRLDLSGQRAETVDIGLCEDSACRPLNEPAGLALAGHNRILVSDTNNHRIVEIDLAGRRHKTWTERLR
ncbi:redoxin domain-containing protein [Telmatospirillum sp.]|uniref:redoxin domain-containing protein n=1 Tax=Telmatospirillum sp. TaxID=2079197 RepID=UPI00284A2532|nr:redoxin domain-containing protein [Telmatospirillum sp.]MDR3437761.1 redoxin domain-containing protein [Telmatospirillum sp.]